MDDITDAEYFSSYHTLWGNIGIYLISACNVMSAIRKITSVTYKSGRSFPRSINFKGNQKMQKYK